MRGVFIEVDNALLGSLEIAQLADHRVAFPNDKVTQAKQALEGVGNLLLNLGVEVDAGVGVPGDYNKVGVGAVPDVVAEGYFAVPLCAGDSCCDDELNNTVGNERQSAPGAKADFVASALFYPSS